MCLTQQHLDDICAICGGTFGLHNHMNGACPKNINDKKDHSDYRQTVFSPTPRSSNVEGSGEKYVYQDSERRRNVSSTHPTQGDDKREEATNCILFPISVKEHCENGIWGYVNEEYNISGYGKTKKEAGDMFRDCVNDALVFKEGGKEEIPDGTYLSKEELSSIRGYTAALSHRGIDAVDMNGVFGNYFGPKMKEPQVKGFLKYLQANFSLTSNNSANKEGERGEKEAVDDGVAKIAAERKRQIEVEKWDLSHDADYSEGELIGAAACYAVNAVNKDRPGFMRVQINLPAETGFGVNIGDRGDRQLRKAGWYDAWPWDQQWDKRDKHDKERSLVIAGALIAAELDRLKSKTLTSKQQSN